ncbi:arrestin domain-containing protein 1b isoform X2 [Corythoichthys intestinalis]|uniref:arrestin domain-containing protein 1b isoform X2 n=1 Tax=Corythoichthys intestinalis TaxID=161448 RepID=UPI0025A4FA29|nr:arrestin domain-containing protein 1b isoform X2 [Corythoichthys intestinalis]
MGKLQEFDITFANNKVVYSPGESIGGTVKIRLSNSLQYKAIKVNCQGSCGISSKLNDTSWTIEEQYFNSTLSVADKAAVPTSFEGPFGKITYRVKAAIDTPRFTKDYKAQRPFYLLNLLNLNEVPDIDTHQTSMAPRTTRSKVGLHFTRKESENERLRRLMNYAVTTKKFNYLLVKSGTLMLKARSDLRGYIPGQVIKLATEIHNKSGKDTGCVLASLIQKVTYKTKRQMFDLRTIAEVEGAGVKAGKHAEWREQIIVPPLPQSALTGCSLIDIDYFIQVALKSPEAVVTLPIYIGNIAINLSPAGTVPSTPDHCDMAIAPNVAGVTPSAPPVEDDEQLYAVGAASEEIPTKSHSQQDSSGQPVTMSPSAFSHAPSAVLPPGRRQHNISAPLFCVSTGATIPFFTEGDPTPVPTSCSLILPPEYSSWDYPHEPPPTYEESCSNTNFSLDSGQ